jgi:excisionase family DNA binding protein
VSPSRNSGREPLLVAEEVAALLLCSLRTVYELTRKREIPHFKPLVSRRCLLRPEELEAGESRAEIEIPSCDAADKSLAPYARRALSSASTASIMAGGFIIRCLDPYPQGSGSRAACMSPAADPLSALRPRSFKTCSATGVNDLFNGFTAIEARPCHVPGHSEN